MFPKMPVYLRVALLLLACALPAYVQAAAFLNCGTTESGHNASGNTLMCEDFEVNGVATVNGHGKWYAEDCDTANGNGGIATRTKGWCGTIFANPITPDGAEICSGNGVNGTTCAGSHGLTSGGGENMADHGLSSADNEIYVRYYQKWLSGYDFGAEKVLSFNVTPGSGGIIYGNLHCNCGAGSTDSQCSFQFQPTGAPPIPQTCQSILTLNSGTWYFIETRIKLSTNASTEDGVLQVWVDDCGSAGTSCSGSPTLRYSDTSIAFPHPGGDIGSLWFENWSNPGSAGTSYIDQIVVSTTGPIGFMDSEEEPDTGTRIALFLAQFGLIAIGLGIIGGIYGKGILARTRGAAGALRNHLRKARDPASVRGSPEKIDA